MIRQVSKGRGRLKVLIVDPDREGLIFVTQIFKNEGLTVFSTNSMSKALKIFEMEQPHIVISEYVLGEYHTVLDFYRKARKIEGDDKKIPFILHTNLRNEPALYQAEIDGIDKCFMKPLNEDGIKRLINAVKLLIKRYRSEN